MIIYRGMNGDIEPVQMECGEAMFDNTHFLTIEEAWESIMSSVKAGVNLAGAAVEYAKMKLANANEEAGEAAELYAKARVKYEDWKSQHDG